MIYQITAALYSGDTIPASCDPVIKQAAAQYNATTRANGKRLMAAYNPATGAIDITLYTINPVPHPLVAAQSFSKRLSLTPSFAPYIRPGRLLART